MTDAPRLTYKRLFNEVVATNRCSECGACVIVCPYNVLHYVGTKPRQTTFKERPLDYCKISEEGVGCDVCAQVCPILQRPGPPMEQAVLGRPRTEQEAQEFGVHREIIAARSKDPRILAVGQDGGVVTTILLWALEEKLIDGAVLTGVDPNKPCYAIPAIATTPDEILKCAGSWYTYAPNPLAVPEAMERGLRRLAFVGTSCHVSPFKKMEWTDADTLRFGRKNEKHLLQQQRYLKQCAEAIVLHIGLLCCETFRYDQMMEGKIQRDMGIPLTEVRQFNVKGKVLIYLKNGEVKEFPLKEGRTMAREECGHCNDFAAEYADISAGGVGTLGWTIVINRTDKGVDVFRRVLEAGLLETKPMDEFPNSMKILLRLARKQRERVAHEFLPGWSPIANTTPTSLQ